MKNITAISIGALIVTSCATPKTTTQTQSHAYKTVSTELMDKTMNPSEDFFMFCNGSWVKNTVIPATESRWGSFNELEKSNNEKLSKILEEFAAQPGEVGTQSQILGAYYASLVNMKQRNDLGISPIEIELKSIESLNRKDLLVEIIASHHRDGIGSAFGYGIGQDLKEVDKNISYLGQGGIGLPNRDYYTEANKKDILKAYQAHISKIFIMSGSSEETALEASASILKFETKLAESMLPPAKMRIPELTYNKMALKEVIKSFGTFDFRYYLSKIGAQNPDSIIVSNPDFIVTLAQCIETESLQTWKYYLIWNVINHYAGHLNQAFVDQNFDFYGRVLKGKKEQKPLNEYAIEEITNLEIGEMLGKAFVEKYYSAEAQKRVNELVDNLLIVFRDRIAKLEWMTPTTKKQARNKLDSIGRKLGFPEQWEDYSSLAFNPGDYVGNIKLMARYSNQKNLAELNKPVDKEKWGMPAHMVNAYYHPLLNEIAFPAGIMQPPFFDVESEDAVNYGRIGMVIGHEFTHGFDDMGSKFAADGSFTNWWTEEVRKALEQRTALLGETFAGVCPMEGNCVNAELTMGENIADLGGLTM
ncbi:MAG: M13 family metallopeptidase, partial [Crocinitomicaceae bacterium]|nr:M13 family metallopeptidase [Crocinitomicaceae bacterium]